MWTKRKRKQLDVVRELLVLSGALCFAYICCDRFVSPASRKNGKSYLRNVDTRSKCLYALSVCRCAMLTRSHERWCSEIRHYRGSISKHVIVFLISNLATGLVNLSMNTIEAPIKLDFRRVLLHGPLYLLPHRSISSSKTTAASKKVDG